MMTYETEKELKAKQKRLTELETLITDATRMMETAKILGDTDAEQAQRRADRALLMQEKLWIERGHTLADWSVFLTEMKAKETAAANAAKAKAKAEADAQAKAQADAEARDAAARKAWEADNDPWMQHKRATSARTF